jgi:hypothetical protein
MHYGSKDKWIGKSDIHQSSTHARKIHTTLLFDEIGSLAKLLV